MKKLLSLLIIGLTIFLIFSGTKKVFIGAKSFFSKYKEEIVEEDLSNIAINTKEEKIKNQEKEGVMIPSYWKNGVEGEENDYLKGYVPSIRTFQEYISTKDNMLFGKVVQVDIFTNYKEIINNLSDSNTILVDGISNENSYFDWSDETCSIFEKTFNGENIFVCDNWVNWMKREIETPMFVFTKCKIDGKTGKCLFLDYSNVYFLEKNIMDTRCLSKEYSDVCKLENYRELIKM